MEAAASLGKFAHGGHEEKEEEDEVRPQKKRVESSSHLDAAEKQDLSLKIENGKSSNESDSNIQASSSPDYKKNPSSRMQQEDKLIESARAEMGQVREENQRLKQCLDQIMKDYTSLKMHFLDIVKKENKTNNNSNRETDQESELSLSLGRSVLSNDAKKEDEKNKLALIQSKENSDDDKFGKEDEVEGLKLGLDCKFELVSRSGTTESPAKPSPTTTASFDEAKEEEAGVETWPPSNALKRSGEDEVSQQNSNLAKKARVSVRMRCDTPTMNDGCQWRKYGQKIAKGNPCPRAYYRCTVAPSCPVRKQVQRCADDMSILITTYEGTHNHPLPMSATTMASTTSAAARMLLSGSSSSSGLPGQYPSSVTTDLQGLNYYLESSKPMMRPSPFYLPTSSISSSTSCPTITLDLTTSNPSSSSSSTHFTTRFNPSTYSTLYPPTRPFPSTSLSFNTSTANSSDHLNPGGLPFSWPPGINNGSGFISGYGPNNAQLYSKGPEISNIYQSYLQKSSSSSSHPPLLPHQQNLVGQDTIAAATKAITADPSFQSALAAALKTIINNNGGGNGAGPGNQGGPQ